VEERNNYYDGSDSESDQDAPYKDSDSDSCRDSDSEYGGNYDNTDIPPGGRKIDIDFYDIEILSHMVESWIHDPFMNIGQNNRLTKVFILSLLHC
jgi:hypothetical protein